MKHLLLSILLAVAFNVSADERDWSVGGGVGYDPQGVTALTITGDWFPTTRSLSWGVRTFGQVAQYNGDNCDGQTGGQVGALPVLTWRGFYAGMGASVGNTTCRLGTAANFVSWGGWKISVAENVEVDASISHWSHCSRCGFASDKENAGNTFFNLAGIWRF